MSVSLEEKKAKYRVVTTVFLKMLSFNPGYGDLEIAGNISRSVTSIHPNFLIRKKRLATLTLKLVMISIFQTLVD